MQIASLSQCFNRQERVKIGKKGGRLSVISLMSTRYKPCSFSAYLRPTMTLVVNTRVMGGTL